MGLVTTELKQMVGRSRNSTRAKYESEIRKIADLTKMADIILVDRRAWWGLFPKLILLAQDRVETNGTKSFFNHAAPYVGGGKVIDATIRGTKLHSLAKLIKPGYSIKIVRYKEFDENPDDPRIHTIVETALSMEGYKYGMITVLLQFLDALLGTNLCAMFAPRKKRFICSETVSVSFAKVNIWFAGTPAENVTPDDIDDATEEKIGECILVGDEYFVTPDDIDDATEYKEKWVTVYRAIRI